MTDTQRIKSSPFRLVLRISALVLILVSTVFWISTGSHTGFSKDRVEIQQVDPITQIEYVDYEERFVFECFNPVNHKALQLDNVIAMNGTTKSAVPAGDIGVAASRPRSMSSSARETSPRSERTTPVPRTRRPCAMLTLILMFTYPMRTRHMLQYM